MKRSFIGGMGDVILAIDYIKQCSELHIRSHQESMTELINILTRSKEISFTGFTDKFSVVTENLPYPPLTDYSTYPESLADLIEILSEYRDTYKEYTVLHPAGSVFANNHATKRGHPLKLIHPDNVKKAIESIPNLIVLGTDLDFRVYYDLDIKKLSLREQIAATIYCNRFIGIDSFFKTIRVALKMPAVVFLQDIKDDYRDKKFIKPYVNDGFMEAVYYSNPKTLDIMNYI